MSTNVTVAASLTTEFTHPSLLREELAHKIYITVRYVLLPCVSVLGIVGNGVSIVILARRGFKKCSNVLLMALSVSDVLLLIGVNNILKYLYVENTPHSFRFSETINYMLYILLIAFYCAYTVGLYSALVIPALITGERLLVIYSPLKAYSILTPRRMLVVISCLYFLSWTHFLYRFIICMHFEQFEVRGITVGVLLYSEVYVNHVRSGLYGLIESIVNSMTGIIPISIVGTGCVVIGIQITLITHRRKQLISRQIIQGSSTLPSRTTKTLLSICVVYIVCIGFSFVRVYVAEIRPMGQDIAFQEVLESIQDLLLCINCVGDFVIYVRANSGYRRSRDTKR